MNKKIILSIALISLFLVACGNKAPDKTIMFSEYANKIEAEEMNLLIGTEGKFNLGEFKLGERLSKKGNYNDLFDEVEQAEIVAMKDFAGRQGFLISNPDYLIEDFEDKDGNKIPMKDLVGFEIIEVEFEEGTLNGIKLLADYEIFFANELARESEGKLKESKSIKKIDFPLTSESLNKDKGNIGVQTTLLGMNENLMNIFDKISKSKDGKISFVEGEYFFIPDLKGYQIRLLENENKDLKLFTIELLGQGNKILKPKLN